jgi:hypothetical protein
MTSPKTRRRLTRRCDSRTGGGALKV